MTKGKGQAEKKQYSIGAVSIFRGGKDTGIIGDERVRILRGFYVNGSYGDYQLLVYGHGPITPDEVYWESSSIPKRVEKEKRKS